MLWTTIQGIKNIPKYSKEEQAEIWQKARKGDQSSIDCLVQSNIKQVIKIAKTFNYDGIELEDLISEGVIGIMMAIDRFDAKKGTKFSSYAHIWIYNRVAKYVRDNGKTVKYPSSLIHKALQIKKYCDAYSSKHNRNPSFERIQQKFKLTRTQLHKMMCSFFPMENIHKNVCGGLSNIETIMIEDEDTTEAHERMDELETKLKYLSKREKKMVFLRYGFNNHKPHSLKQIADIMGMPFWDAREQLISIRDKIKSKY